MESCDATETQDPRGRLARIWIWPGLAWLAVLVTSSFLMMPNTDDPFYFLPGLGLLNEGVLAIPVNGRLDPIFFNFPTFSFLQGLFLFVTQAVGVPVDYYTHRLFNGVVVAGLLGLSLRYVRLTVSAEGTPPGAVKLVLLLTLGITPFAQSWLLVRPEPLGLLCVVGTLVLHQYWVASGRTRRPILLASAFLVGVPLTLHPLFFPISGLLALSFLFLEFRVRTNRALLAAAVVIAVVPVAAMAAYYLFNLPGSAEQLLSQAQNGTTVLFTGFEGLVRRVLPFSGDGITIRRVVGSMFFTPLLLLILVDLALLVSVFGRRRRSLDIFLPLTMLFLSIPVVLALFFNFIYVFGVIAFVASLFFAVTAAPQIGAVTKFLARGRRYWLVVIFSVAGVGLWTELNIAKYVVFPERYLRPGAVLDVVAGAAGGSARLFVTLPELVPLFLRQFEDTMAHSENTALPTYWLFSASGRLSSADADIEQMRIFLESEVDGGSGHDIFFVSANSFDSAEMTACVQLLRTPFRIGISVSDVLHTDDRYVIVRSRSQSLDCQPAGE